MSSPYAEAGKAIGRGMAHRGGEQPDVELLPAPTCVERTDPVPFWRLIRVGAEQSNENLNVCRTKLQGNPVILLGRGPTTIAVDLRQVDELIDVLRAAKLWVDDPPTNGAATAYTRSELAEPR